MTCLCGEFTVNLTSARTFSIKLCSNHVSLLCPGAGGCPSTRRGTPWCSHQAISPAYWFFWVAAGNFGHFSRFSQFGVISNLAGGQPTWLLNQPLQRLL